MAERLLLKMSFTRINRKIHKWGSILLAAPLIIIIITGILLLLRKEFAAIQPPSQIGIGHSPSISFEKILQIARSVPETEISDWQDIARLDVRPNKGIVKLRTENSWEIQIDTQTGDVLQVAYRRSDWLESLHDGTFFHKNANLWLMLPTGIILLALWLTGLYLFIYPYIKKYSNKNK